MRRKSVDKKKNYIALIPFFIVICVALLSIGWAAFQSTFNVSNLYAIVRIDRDIRVTDVQATSNTNSGRSNYENYNVSSLYSAAYLPNQNSTITYKVEITNVGNVKEGIYSIEEIYKIINTDVDSNLEIKSTTLALKEVLCDDTNSSQCKLGSVSTFYVTIGYKTNGYDGINNTHLVTLNFDFRRVFDINYYGFGNTSGIANSIMQGDTKNITFNSTTGIPANVTTVGATGSYNSNAHQLTLSNVTATGINETINVSRHYGVTYSGFSGNTSNLPTSIIYSGGTITIDSTAGYPSSVTVTGATGTYNDQTHVLTISNITGNITVTASSGNTQVVDNGDGTITTSTETVTNNSDGSTTTQVAAVTTDSQGNVLSYSDSETTENTNGTTTTTTTNYDANHNPTTGSTSNTDTNGNVNTQEVAYDSNGASTVTGYTIDTSGNSSGGEVINNSTIDTGMIVFDGKGFEMNMVFKAKTSENAGNAIFAAMQHISGKKYSGFNFTIYSAVNLYIYAGTNSTLNENTGVFGSQINASRPFKIDRSKSTAVTTYTMKFRYLPGNYSTNTNQYGQVYVELSPIVSGAYNATSPYTKNSTVIPTSLTDATFTLGGNGFTNNQNMVNFEVVSFEVHKI